jgi:hypothetical protein
MNAAAQQLAQAPSPAVSMREGPAILRFMLAGNATFTIVSVATGARFTFRVRAKKGPRREGVRFVSVLTGPCNEGDYQFLGTIFLSGEDGLGTFIRSGKSAIASGARSIRAFGWFWQRLMQEQDPEPVAEFWHEGTCGRCGRKLTVPESIASGLGPECAARE